MGAVAGAVVSTRGMFTGLHSGVLLGVVEFWVCEVLKLGSSIGLKVWLALNGRTGSVD